MNRRGLTGLTTRAVLLGLVVCALVLSLAYPIKEYLGQRAQIAALEQQAREQTDRVEALQERAEQLRDPAIVEQEARERLKYVMPGDRVYVVVERDGSGAPEPAEPEPRAAEVPDPGSWYERLADSVERADSG
jgi:cell division protein FtsB